MTTWHKKHSPKTSQDFIGFEKITKNIKKWFHDYENQKTSKKSLLITGQHGFGKTSCLNMILEELNYQVIWLSPDNIPVQKEIAHFIRDKTQCRDITSFFTGQIKNKVIVVDELDGMSQSNRTSIGGLMDMLSIKMKKRGKKKTKVKPRNRSKLMVKISVPIVFICSGGYNRLISHLKRCCLHIKFERLPDKQMYQIIDNVSKTEDFKINLKKKYELSEIVKGDIRQLLFKLQDLKYDTLKNNDCCSKDINYEIYNGTNYLINNYNGINNCLQMFYINPHLMPLMIHQNFLKFIDLNKINYDFNVLSDIFKCLSKANIIEKLNISSQEIRDIWGVFACVIPSYLLNDIKKAKTPTKLSFTENLQTHSQMSSNRNNIDKMCKRFNIENSVTDMYFVRNVILYHILNDNGDSSISKDLIKSYNLSPDIILQLVKIDKIDKKYSRMTIAKIAKQIKNR